MSRTHSFSVDAAVEIGIKEAILLGSIQHWCEKNASNHRHLHDGRYWTYNSASAWVRLFPYMSKSAVKRCLTKLEDDGYIVTGNFNRRPNDKTKWYSITDKGTALLDGLVQNGPEQENEQLVQNGPSRSKMGQQLVQNGPTLPIHTTNSIPIQNPLSMEEDGPDKQMSLFAQSDEPSALDELVEYYYETTNRVRYKSDKKLRGHLNARLKDGFTADQIKGAIRKKTDDVRGTKWERLLNPDWLLAPGHFVDALNLPDQTTASEVKHNDGWSQSW